MRHLEPTTSGEESTVKAMFYTPCGRLAGEKSMYCTKLVVSTPGEILWCQQSKKVDISSKRLQG